MVMAPIRTPYREYIERIWSMLTNDRAEIYERLKNGTDLKLTVQNFDIDNNQQKSETNPAPVSDTEVQRNSQPQQVQNNNQNNGNQFGNGKKNNKKKNKGNNQNQYQQQFNQAPVRSNELAPANESKNEAPIETEQVTPEEVKSEEHVTETAAQTVQENEKVEETKELTPEEKKEESAALAVDVETA